MNTATSGQDGEDVAEFCEAAAEWDHDWRDGRCTDCGLTAEVGSGR